MSKSLRRGIFVFLKKFSIFTVIITFCAGNVKFWGKFNGSRMKPYFAKTGFSMLTSINPNLSAMKQPPFSP